MTSLRRGKLAIVAAVLGTITLSTSNIASAAVVQFNDFVPTNPSVDFRGFTVAEEGFLFANGGGLGYIQWNAAGSPNADPTGHTLSSILGSTTITKDGGGLFDFTSIDFADVLNVGFAQELQLSWIFDGGATGSSVFTLDSLAGLQTYSNALVGLTSFMITPTLTGFFSGVQIDNVVLSGSVSDVPLPAGMILLLSGLVSLGAVGRQRRRRNA